MQLLNKIRYGEGDAPFGAMELVVPMEITEERPTLEFLLDNVPGDSAIAMMQITIACQTAGRAWAGSGWLQDAVRPKDFASIQEAMGSESAYGKPDYLKGSRERLANALSCDEEALVLAIEPKDAVNTPPDMEEFDATVFPIHRVVGFGNVFTEECPVRPQKLMHRVINVMFGYPDPLETRANLENVNVLPRRRGKGLGAAITAAALAYVPEDAALVTAVPSADLELAEQLRQFGFRTDGETVRRDAIVLSTGRGIDLAETRLVAESVGEVRESIAQAYPWVNNSEADVSFRS